jgi:CheY-like chemotaxis protein
MPEGGCLTISAENTTVLVPPGRLEARRDPGPFLRLVVSDTGTGIPLEIREKIFDPFFTTKETGKGTGLGLSTTIEIVKRHGGHINLYSEMGKGTAFNIYLPASGQAKLAGKRGPEADLPRGAGELVLVVDDEESIRAIATQTLQTFGYQSIAAQDGAEAVKLYQRHGAHIAAVLVDVMMPVMDGLTAIQSLKSINPNVKIIAASGLSSEAHGIHVSQDSIRAFLLKPYNSQTLLTTLHNVLHDDGAHPSHPDLPK